MTMVIISVTKKRQNLRRESPCPFQDHSPKWALSASFIKE